MNWFRDLTGFDESAETVREYLRVEGTAMVSTVNGRRMEAGELTTPTLAELRALSGATTPSGRLRVSEVVGGVGALHRDPANAGALFQVASQFNLLEMVAPSVTPEIGVTGYANDHTQGPACAISCGAGTIFRNWFVEVDGQRGQTATRQLDMLADVGRRLGNDGERLWTMQNGYALATGDHLDELQDVPDRHEDLRIGLHTATEVTTAATAAAPGHAVTQAYCSALPVAYTRTASAVDLEPFARMVLNSAYAATLHAAKINAATAAGQPGSNRVFLTLLGGGVFGNALEWILDAIEAALDDHRDAGLDVRIVSHGSPNPALAPLLSH